MLRDEQHKLMNVGTPHHLFMEVIYLNHSPNTFPDGPYLIFIYHIRVFQGCIMIRITKGDEICETTLG